ncbi:MAG TPA: polysaccharide deacetylase family protein [Anaerolineae bacterium]|nr:polysaccharide deacetylase family protein [Anaerolineae bacterium]
MNIAWEFDRMRNLWPQLGWGFGLIVMAGLLGLTGCARSEANIERTPIVLAVEPAATSAARADSPARPTPDPHITPEPPPVFQTNKLLRGAKPVTYIDDTCEYLRRRWDPNNAAPGTIIVPIMYHRVKEKPGERGVNQAYFKQTMRKAHELGFQTITAEQAADFLERNAYIPPRSLMLFVDDRRVPVINKHFMPFLKKYNWTVISAWIIANTDQRPGLWERIEAAYQTGHVDVQSHGLRHLYIIPGTPKKQIREELFGPFPYFEEHFGYRPVAFIWPGGNYIPYAVRVAREAGYRIGFTIIPNGPIMFNWIPLQKAERQMGDPLLLLPRYHANSVKEQLPIAVEIGEKAKAQALAHYPQEAAWYREHCGGELPPPTTGYR